MTWKESPMERNASRIWELDALRGFSILAVIVIHFLYDIQLLFGYSVLDNPILSLFRRCGGVIFILLSGVCVTLGSHSIRRGLLVFSCGLLITMVTAVMAHLGLPGKEVLILFGILHLLGSCMLLWPLFRRITPPLLTVLGALSVVLGLWLSSLTVISPWLFPLGLVSPGFASADYFPLFPHLGWFLLGAAIGKTLYRNRQTLFPGSAQDLFLFRFFRICGIHSLWIYLLHQPVLFLLLWMCSK